MDGRPMPTDRVEPTLPERARTALSQAASATLIPRRCPPRSDTVLTVAVEDDPQGRHLVHLDSSTPAVRILAACPVVTLSVVGPTPFRRLDLTGSLELRRGGRRGLRTYRFEPLAGRLVGATSVPVAMAEFRAARPDPLAPVAGQMLAHLAEAHAHELLACLRAHGHLDAEAAEPVTLDRYGLELAALVPTGVQRVRLAFPNGPIQTHQQIPPGLRLPLQCRCRGSNRADE